LPAAFIARLWLAATVSAALGWGVKLVIGARHPVIVAAFVLSAYGVLYFGLTYAFGLPEARTVIGRFTRIVRRPRG
jgi:hypothetical protein